MHSARMKYLALAVTGAMAAMWYHGSDGASAKTIWNYNTFGGKRAFTKGIETMKEEMEKAGGGDFELRINYADALGPTKQNPDNVKIGAFEAGQICVGYYPNKFPLMSVMELPFLPPRDIHAMQLVQEDLQANPLIKAELKDLWNSRYLAPSFVPPFEFMGNKRIETVEDMKGVKMRISGLNAKALAVFGAVPTMVTAPEGYSALDRGTIDSFGFPYSYAFGAYKLYEVSKYATEGLAMNGFLCFQMVNEDAWNAAPEKARAVVAEAQQLGSKRLIEAYAEEDKKWLPIFHEKLDVVKIDPKTRNKLIAGAGKIWEEWVQEQEAKGRPGREVLEFVKASVAKHTK
jgi:TRAP-type C4-dicarboxylate transport system substrate-binding protein